MFGSWQPLQRALNTASPAAASWARAASGAATAQAMAATAVSRFANLIFPPSAFLLRPVWRAVLAPRLQGRRGGSSLPRRLRPQPLQQLRDRGFQLGVLTGEGLAQGAFDG